MNKVKKILFIYKIDIPDPKTLGIYDKLQTQMGAWKHFEYESDFVSLTDIYGVLNKKGLTNYFKNFFSLMFFKYCTKILKSKKYDNNYQVIYIRHVPICIGLNDFLSFLKVRYPKTKIILDLPTYPYLYEYKGLKKVIATYLSPKEIKNHCDFITHLGHEDIIFDVPVIKINNSIDVSKINAKARFDNSSEEVRLLSVSSLWESYDLPDLITAISIFNNLSSSKKIRLTIVGDGDKKEMLQDLVDTLRLKKYVTFTGFLYGNDLEAIINQSDLGVGRITSDFKNFKYTQALKHRMYAGHGLPFFTNINDPAFSNNDLILVLENEKIDIDLLHKVYDWHLTNLETYKTKSEELRSFAEVHLNEQINVKKILTFVEKLNN